MASLPQHQMQQKNPFGRSFRDIKLEEKRQNSLNGRRTRSFQSNNFGSKDSLPAWKQKMLSRLVNSSRKNRATLMDRLKKNRDKNKNNNFQASPKSRKKEANQTIDNYKHQILKEIMDEMKKNDPYFSTKVSKTNFEDVLQVWETEHFAQVRKDSLVYSANEQASFMIEDENSLMNELELETQFTSNNNNNNNNSNINNNQQNNSYINSNTNSKSNLNSNKNMSESQLACPICNIGCVDAQCLDTNRNQMQIYECYSCQAQWQSSIENVRFPMKISINNSNNNNNNNSMNDFNSINQSMLSNLTIKCSGNDTRMENDTEHGFRMLKSLKNILNNVHTYHNCTVKCNGKLNFAVEEKSKLLQVWCNQCKFNSLL